MSPFVRVSLIVLALGMLLPAATVSAQSVYKWIDKDGVVHYSDQPPPEPQQSERVQIQSLGSPRQAEVDNAASEGSDRAERPESAPCATARQNLVVFENSDEIQMDLDGDGTAETLTPEQREQELERTRNLITVLCR